NRSARAGAAVSPSATVSVRPTVPFRELIVVSPRSRQFSNRRAGGVSPLFGPATGGLRPPLAVKILLRQFPQPQRLIVAARQGIPAIGREGCTGNLIGLSVEAL